MYRVAQIFAKILGGQGFPENIARVSNILGFFAFLFYKSFEVCLGGGGGTNNVYPRLTQKPAGVHICLFFLNLIKK